VSRLLVLGLGNLLCRDDGAGLAALSWLSERYLAPEGALLLDGGTLGLSLLPCLEDADEAILLDAVRVEGAPGTLVRLEGEAVTAAARERLSVHQIGVADLLEGARWMRRLPSRLVLLGVVPATVGLGVGCSPAVAAAVPGLAELAVQTARHWGHRFRRKPDARGDANRGGARRLPGA
jgi:hydrogenase maturation protease